MDQGFKSKKGLRILKTYIIDNERLRQLKEISQVKEDALLTVVRSNCLGKEKLNKVLAYDSSISCASAL